MRFVSVFIPNFPLQTAIRLKTEVAWPDGKKIPTQECALAILDGKPPWVTVVAVNEKAWRAGVEVGMTKLQAESCPSVVFCHRSLTQERAAQSALLDCAHAISPRVESAAPGLVLLDVQGLGSLYSTEENLAAELTRLASQVGLQVNVSVAGNPDSALHAARGFPGITIIPAGEETLRLGELPVELLSPPSEILETLDRWGIHCFRELAALPSTALAERLGQEGVRLQRLARGKEQRLLVPMQPPLQFEEAMEMDEPVETLEPLLFLLNSMLGQLCSRLAARALAVHRLDLILDLDVHDDIQLRDREKRAAETSVAPLKDSKDPAWRIHQRTLQLPVPMRNSHELFKLLQLDLSAHPPMALVKKVTLKAEPARPRVTQAGLLIPAAPEPEQLEVTLGRIRHVVGDGSPSSQPQRVGSAEILDTHRPGAFRMLPFCPTGESRAIVRPSSRPHTLALRVFRPPLAVRVELRGLVPRRLLINDLPTMGRWRAQVVSASGPWQTSGQWWSRDRWAREEWDLWLNGQEKTPLKAEEPPNGLYRVFRDLLRGDWYVEGVYD